MSWKLKSQFFKQPESYIGYRLIFVTLALVCLVATIIIPWWYDQKNLEIFKKAVDSNNLLVREYAALQVNDEIINNNSMNNSVPPLKKQISLIETLQDKKLISLDYIHQMKKADQLHDESIRWRILSLIGIAGVILWFILTVVKNHFVRTPLVFIIFVLALAAFWFTGLPHVNYKFHIIIGFIYAVILAGSDFLHTYSNQEDISYDSSSGCLSSLQYRHRFWCVILNAIILTLLTTFGTISFKTLDFFYKVFGESFVTLPLVGLSFSLAMVLLIAVAGILYPIRNNIYCLEKKMENMKSGDP